MRRGSEDEAVANPVAADEDDAGFDRSAEPTLVHTDLSALRAALADRAAGRAAVRVEPQEPGTASPEGASVGEATESEATESEATEQSAAGERARGAAMDPAAEDAPAVESSAKRVGTLVFDAAAIRQAIVEMGAEAEPPESEEAQDLQDAAPEPQELDAAPEPQELDAAPEPQELYPRGSLEALDAAPAFGLAKPDAPEASVAAPALSEDAAEAPEPRRDFESAPDVPDAYADGGAVSGEPSVSDTLVGDLEAVSGEAVLKSAEQAQNAAGQRHGTLVLSSEAFAELTGADLVVDDLDDEEESGPQPEPAPADRPAAPVAAGVVARTGIFEWPSLDRTTLTPSTEPDPDPEPVWTRDDAPSERSPSGDRESAWNDPPLRPDRFWPGAGAEDRGPTELSTPGVSEPTAAGPGPDHGEQAESDRTLVAAGPPDVQELERPAHHGTMAFHPGGLAESVEEQTPWSRDLMDEAAPSGRAPGFARMELDDLDGGPQHGHKAGEPDEGPSESSPRPPERGSTSTMPALEAPWAGRLGLKDKDTQLIPAISDVEPAWTQDEAPASSKRVDLDARSVAGPVGPAVARPDRKLAPQPSITTGTPTVERTAASDTRAAATSFLRAMVVLTLFALLAAFGVPTIQGELLQAPWKAVSDPQSLSFLCAVFFGVNLLLAVLPMPLAVRSGALLVSGLATLAFGGLLMRDAGLRFLFRGHPAISTVWLDGIGATILVTLAAVVLPAGLYARGRFTDSRVARITVAVGALVALAALFGLQALAPAAEGMPFVRAVQVAIADSSLQGDRLGAIGLLAALVALPLSALAFLGPRRTGLCTLWAFVWSVGLASSLVVLAVHIGHIEQWRQVLEPLKLALLVAAGLLLTPVALGSLLGALGRQPAEQKRR